jgi:hypothetical protein
MEFGFPGNAVIGTTMRTNPGTGQPELWFGWDAGHAMASGTPGTCGFAQTHIEISVVNAADLPPTGGAQAGAVIGQLQVWNPTIAFAYPSFASNSTGEVGMSLLYGGGGNDANHAVGFWGDFLVYSTTSSDTSINRNGDYVTIRRSFPATELFSGEGYGTKVANANNNCPAFSFAPGAGSSQPFCFDPHYALFGRPG